MSGLAAFRQIIEEKYPIVSKTMNETINSGGERLSLLAEEIIDKYTKLVDNKIELLAQSYASLVTEFNVLQLKYEMAGHYPSDNYQDALSDVYLQEERHKNYLVGLVCTQFLWINHFRVWCFFEDEFVNHITPHRVLEIAPGHGLMGLTLLKQHPGAELLGIDISPMAISLSKQIASIYDIHSVQYKVGDGLDMPETFRNHYDTIVCGELLEHLPNPSDLLYSIYDCLNEGGNLFLTAAITAAAPDHIYEFCSPEEVLDMVKKAGFKIGQFICEGTKPLTPKAKGAPRVVAIIAQK